MSEKEKTKKKSSLITPFSIAAKGNKQQTINSSSEDYSSDEFETSEPSNNNNNPRNLKDLYKLIKIQYNSYQDEFSVESNTLSFTNDQLLNNDNLQAPYASYTNDKAAHRFIKAIERVIEQSTFKE
ncbi:14808_t:CDS:2, partial [Racocetra fulgida]